MAQPLVLLHGALGAASQLETLAVQLGHTYEVSIYEFPGHGQTANDAREMSIELLAADFHAWLKKKYNAPVKIFGYSMGGYVCLYLAVTYPQLFEKVLTLGTKFKWSAEEALKETAKLEVNFLQEKAPAYCEYLQQLHGAHWQTVLQKTAGLMKKLGEKPLLNNITLSFIQTPVDLLLGERDKMVSREETEEACAHITGAGMQIVPGFVHPLERLETQELAKVIAEYLV